MKSGWFAGTEGLGSKLRILICSPDPETALKLSKAAGPSVDRLAACGPDLGAAVAEAARLSPDLVVLDAGLLGEAADPDSLIRTAYEFRTPLVFAVDSETRRRLDNESSIRGFRYISKDAGPEEMRLAAAGALNGGFRAGETAGPAETDERDRALLHEKEILLQEVHHRVKNNLQLMQSLLHMQQRRSSDPAVHDALEAAAARIGAMAAAHESVYRSASLADMNLQGFLQETIAKVIKRGQEGRTAVRFELDVDAEITVPREKAVTCALALTELLRNACRHAFPGRADGLVRISASVRPNRRLEITIADDGVGFARTGPEEASDGCGLHLVHGLARHQLRGEASVDSVPAGGTLVRLAFPLEEPNE